MAIRRLISSSESCVVKRCCSSFTAIFTSFSWTWYSGEVKQRRLAGGMSGSLYTLTTHGEIGTLLHSIAEPEKDVMSSVITEHIRKNYVHMLVYRHYLEFMVMLVPVAT